MFAHDQLSLAVLVFLFLLPSSSPSPSCQPSFDYSHGPLGPRHWGSLYPNWTTCSSGQSQSPIDFTTSHLLPYSQRITSRYQNNSASILESNCKIDVEWHENGGAIYLAGVQYELSSLHLHSPSEHTIDGVRFPLEMHMVHVGPQNQTAVVSILYEYGERDELLARIIDEAPRLGEGEQIEVGNLTVVGIKLGSRYYHYTGSLTTPPCTEGVTWIIPEKKQEVTKDQVKAILKAQMGENARPLQSLNGRSLYEHK